MTIGMMSYELLKEAIQMYDEGEIGKSHPLLASGVENIRESLKEFETNVLKIDETQKEWVHDVLSKECPHCKFISETFGEKMSNSEYWILTEVFVYLHGTDECNFEK